MATAAVLRGAAQLAMAGLPPMWMRWQLAMRQAMLMRVVWQLPSPGTGRMAWRWHRAMSCIGVMVAGRQPLASAGCPNAVRQALTSSVGATHAPLQPLMRTVFGLGGGGGVLPSPSGRARRLPSRRCHGRRSGSACLSLLMVV